LITHFADCKTCAVHFEALTLPAVAAGILDFLFNWRGKKSGFKGKGGGKAKIKGKRLFVVISF
jgi:hypothetical protein